MVPRPADSAAPEGASTDPWVPRVLAVAGARDETVGVRTLTIDPAAVDGGAGIAPGQFAMLYVFGVGEVPISFSGTPDDGPAVAHTVREVGPVTRALCALEAGERIGWRGPFGRGWPLAEAEGGDLALIAGGIGLAPLRPALRAVKARRDRFGRVALLYGARGPGDMLFLPELRAACADADIQLLLAADHAEPGWTGEVGVVPAFLPRLKLDPARTRAFVCGPEAMMRYTVLGLGDLGVGADRIFVSMERNMKCAVGLCGRCQFGGDFVCRDGPVFPFADIAARFAVRER